MNYRLKRIQKGKPLKNAEFRGSPSCLFRTQLPLVERAFFPGSDCV
jgi:hypothetical protein